MYGMKKRPRDDFEFDLEKEIKTDPKRRDEIIKSAEDAVTELKGILRDADPKSKDFEKYGILLHGFVALQTVVGKIKD